MPFDMAHDKPGYPAAWEPQSGGVGAASADSSGRAPTHDKPGYPAAWEPPLTLDR